MPTPSITMRKLKEILRLKYGAKLSHRQIARSLSISASVVSRYATEPHNLVFPNGLCQKAGTMPR